MEAPRLSLKELRKQARRSQKECAELLDLSIDTWGVGREPGLHPYASAPAGRRLPRTGCTDLKGTHHGKDFGKVPVVAVTDIDLDEEMKNLHRPDP